MSENDIMAILLLLITGGLMVATIMRYIAIEIAYRRYMRFLERMGKQ